MTGILTGALSDKRIATVVFYVLATFICVQELGKTTRATFRKQYTTIRFIAYALLFVHSFFGLLTALWVVNKVYTEVTFTFLSISCTCNLFYQAFSLYLLLIKLQTVTTTGASVTFFSKAITTAIVLKTLLSLGSLCVMFYMVSTLSVAGFYQVGWADPIMKTASIINLSGNGIYIFLLFVIQFFFLHKVTKHVSDRVKTLASASSDGNNSAIINFRHQISVIVLCLGGTIMMVVSIMRMVNHSIGLSLIAFTSALILSLFDTIDISAVNAITGGAPQTRKITESSFSKPNNFTASHLSLHSRVKNPKAQTHSASFGKDLEEGEEYESDHERDYFELQSKAAKNLSVAQEKDPFMIEKVSPANSFDSNTTKGTPPPASPLPMKPFELDRSGSPLQKKFEAPNEPFTFTSNIQLKNLDNFHPKSPMENRPQSPVQRGGSPVNQKGKEESMQQIMMKPQIQKNLSISTKQPKKPHKKPLSPLEKSRLQYPIQKPAGTPSSPLLTMKSPQSPLSGRTLSPLTENKEISFQSPIYQPPSRIQQARFSMSSEDFRSEMTGDSSENSHSDFESDDFVEVD